MDSLEWQMAISLLQKVAAKANIPVEGLATTFIHRESDGIKGLYPGVVQSIQHHKKRTGEKCIIHCTHPGRRGGGAKSASKFEWDENDKVWRKMSCVWGSEVVLGTNLGKKKPIKPA